MFRRDATPESHRSIITDNPHNQFLVIALELGTMGGLALLAMWTAHLLLFRGHTVLDWFGLMLVVQSVVSCLFNSQFRQRTKIVDCLPSYIRQARVNSTGGLRSASR